MTNTLILAVWQLGKLVCKVVPTTVLLPTSVVPPSIIIPSFPAASLSLCISS